jgi:WD40 repeat protein
VAFAPDGRRLVWGVDPPGVEVWDLAGPAGEAPPLALDSDPASLAFSSDGKRLAAGKYGQVFLQDMEPPAGAVLDGHHKDGYDAVALSPNDKFLIAHHGGGTVELWDVPSGRNVHTWHLPGPVRRLAFPDGRHLITGNANGTLYVLRLDPALTRP